MTANMSQHGPNKIHCLQSKLTIIKHTAVLAQQLAHTIYCHGKCTLIQWKHGLEETSKTAEKHFKNCATFFVWHSGFLARTWQFVRNMVINYPNYLLPSLLYFILLLKTFSLFLGNKIWYLSYLWIYILFKNCSREAYWQSEGFAEFQLTFLFWKALCLEHVWNTCLATTISSLRPKPLGGQTYIPMSPLNS